MPSRLIRLFVLLVLLTLFMLPKSHGQNVLNITDSREFWSLDEYIYLFVDTTKQNTIEEVLQLDFVPNPKKPTTRATIRMLIGFGFL